MAATAVQIKAVRKDHPAITLRGGAGALVWGYRPAAQLKSWVIWKDDTAWRLKASVQSADAFQCRQRPMLFTAPKTNGPPWCWEVRELNLREGSLEATLGAPLQ